MSTKTVNRMVRKYSDKLYQAKNLTQIQGDNGNWDYDPYMHGLYNGMELILAIFEERDPMLRDVPDKWIRGELGWHKND